MLPLRLVSFLLALTPVLNTIAGKGVKAQRLTLDNSTAKPNSSTAKPNNSTANPVNSTDISEEGGEWSGIGTVRLAYYPHLCLDYQFSMTYFFAKANGPKESAGGLEVQVIFPSLLLSLSLCMCLYLFDSTQQGLLRVFS